MFAKVYQYKFGTVAEAKVAASFCADNLGKKISKYKFQSLNVMIGKEGDLSIFIKFDTIDRLKKYEAELQNIKSPIILKNFFTNIDEILANSNLAICRAGAGTIVDLINFKLPSILIPLPSSKDNHQFYNAEILAKHDLAIIFDQNNDDLDKAKRHIYETYSNESKLELMNKKFDMIKVKNSNTLIYKLILNAN